MSEVGLVVLGGGIAVVGGLVASLANGALQRSHDTRADIRQTVDEGLVSAAESMEGLTTMWESGAGLGRKVLPVPGAEEIYETARIQTSSGKRGLNITLSKMNARLGPKHALPLAVDEFKKEVGVIQSMLPSHLRQWDFVAMPTLEDRKEIEDLLASAEVGLVRLEAVSAKTLNRWTLGLWAFKPTVKTPD